MKVDIDNRPGGYRISGNEGTLHIVLDRYYILLNQFCFLDILSTNNFKRPIYFATTVSRDNFLGMEKYFECEGMAYKLTPTGRTTAGDRFITGYLDTDIQFKKLMEEEAFHLPYENQKYYNLHERTIENYRNVYGRLAQQLIDEDKNDKALRVLNYCATEFPPEKSGYGYQSLNLIESWFRIDQFDAANEMVATLFHSCTDFLPGDDTEDLDVTNYETRLNIRIVAELLTLTNKYIQGSDLNNEISEVYNSITEKIN